MFRRLLRPALAAPFLIPVVVAHAASPGSTIVESAGQPFYVSGNSGRSGAPANAGRMEFTGILESRDGVEVSLKNTATGRAEWVRLHDPGAAYFVENFDSGTKTIRVRLDGVPTRIFLNRESSNSPMAGRERVSGNEGAPPVTHVRADGLTWSEPLPDQGRHPNDPGNAD